MTRVPVVIREYQDGDSIKEITHLLHEAYALLAEQGLRYVASWQTHDMTQERIGQGICFLALDDNKIVGTAMLHETSEDSDCEFYRLPGVFHFGKFAVDPDRQGEGIGTHLFQAVEAKAREMGAEQLACDTAEPATHLIEMYRYWGMEIVAKVDWSMTNYMSVVMAKRL